MLLVVSISIQCTCSSQLCSKQTYAMHVYYTNMHATKSVTISIVVIIPNKISVDRYTECCHT